MNKQIKISVGFSRPSKFDFVTKAIMWKLGTQYSHSYIKIRDVNTGRIVVFHADGPAFKADVHCLSFKNFLKTKEEVFTYSTNVSFTRGKEIWDFLWDKCGTDYGEGQLFRILFKINKSNGREKYICSELVADCLREELFINIKDLDRFTPKDLREKILLLPDVWRPEL